MNGSKGILITDNGPHSPEKWALATADHLVHLKPNADAAKHMAAMKLELAIAEILVPHHANIQDGERSAIAAQGSARLAAPLDPSSNIPLAVQAIVDVAKGTPWEEHFAKREVQDSIALVVGQHFADAMHIERSWHADRNPDAPGVAEWRAAHHPGAPALAPDEPPAHIAQAGLPS